MWLWFYLSLIQSVIIGFFIFYKLVTLIGQTPPNRVKHRARGTTYDVIGIGMIQTEIPLTDYDKVFVYQDIETDEIWVRREAEFNYDRFEPIK